MWFVVGWRVQNFGWESTIPTKIWFWVRYANGSTCPEAFFTDNTDFISDTGSLIEMKIGGIDGIIGGMSSWRLWIELPESYTRRACDASCIGEDWCLEDSSPETCFPSGIYVLPHSYQHYRNFHIYLSRPFPPSLTISTCADILTPDTLTSLGPSPTCISHTQTLKLIVSPGPTGHTLTADSPICIQSTPLLPATTITKDMLNCFKLTDDLGRFKADNSYVAAQPSIIMDTDTTYYFTLQPTSALSTDTVFIITLPPELTLSTPCVSTRGTCTSDGLGVVKLSGVLSAPYTDLTTSITFAISTFTNPSFPYLFSTLPINVKTVDQATQLDTYHQSDIYFSNTGRYSPYQLTDANISISSYYTYTQATYDIRFTTGHNIPAGAVIAVFLPDSIKFLTDEIFMNKLNLDELATYSRVDDTFHYIQIEEGFEDDLPKDTLVHFEFGYFLNPLKIGATSSFRIAIYLINSSANIEDEVNRYMYYFYTDINLEIDITHIKEFPLFTVTPLSLTTNQLTTYRVNFISGDGDIIPSHELIFKTFQYCDTDTFITSEFTISSITRAERNYTINLSSKIGAKTLGNFEIRCRNPETERPSQPFSLWLKGAYGEYCYSQTNIPDMSRYSEYQVLTFTLHKLSPRELGTITFNIQSTTIYTQINTIRIEIPLTMEIVHESITSINGISPELDSIISLEINQPYIYIQNIRQLEIAYSFILCCLRNPSLSTDPIYFEFLSYEETPSIQYKGQEQITSTQYILCNFPCKACAEANPDDCISCFPKDNEVFTVDGISLHMYHNGKCLSSCPTHTYNNTITTCEDCDPTCKECEDRSSKCTECDPSGTNIFLYNEECWTSCPTRTYNNTATSCDSCAPPCWECDELPNNCTHCNPIGTTKHYLHNNLCLTTCPQPLFNIDIQWVCGDHTLLFHSDTVITVLSPTEIAIQAPYEFRLRCQAIIPENVSFKLDFPPQLGIYAVEEDICSSSLGVCSIITPTQAIIEGILTTPYTDMTSVFTFTVQIINPNTTIKYSDVEAISMMIYDEAETYQSGEFFVSNEGRYKGHPLENINIVGSEITATKTTYKFNFTNPDYPIPADSSIVVIFSPTYQFLGDDPILNTFFNLDVALCAGTFTLPSTLILRNGFSSELAPNQGIQFRVGNILTPYEVGETTFVIHIYINDNHEYIIFTSDTIKHSITEIAPFPLFTIIPDSLRTFELINYTFNVEIGDGEVNSMHTLTLHIPLTCLIDTFTPTGFTISTSRFDPAIGYSFRFSLLILPHATISFIIHLFYSPYYIYIYI